MGERRRNANIIPKDPSFTLLDCGCRTIQFVRKNPADVPRPLIIDGANAILAAFGRKHILNKPTNPVTCKKLLALIRLIIFCDFEVIVVIPNSFILNQQTSVHLEPLIEMGIVKKCPAITYDDNQCFIEAQKKRGTVLSNDQFKDLKVIGVDYRHFIEQHSVILIIRQNDDPTFGNFYTSDGHYISDVVFDFGSCDYNRYFVEPGQEDYAFLKKQEKKRSTYWPDKKKEILCFIDDALIDITLFEAGRMKKEDFITKKYRKAEVYKAGKKLPKKTESEQNGPVVRDYVDPFGLRTATDVDYSNFKELNVYDSRTKVFNRRELPNQNIYDWEKLLKEQERQKAGEKVTANKSPEKPSTSQPAGSSAASKDEKVKASTQRLQQADQKEPLEEKKKMKKKENAFTAFNSQVSINLHPLLDSSDEEDNGKKPVQGTSHKGTFYPRQTGKAPNRKNSPKQSGQGTNASKCNQRGNRSSANSQQIRNSYQGQDISNYPPPQVHNSTSYPQQSLSNPPNGTYQNYQPTQQLQNNMSHPPPGYPIYAPPVSPFYWPNMIQQQGQYPVQSGYYQPFIQYYSYPMKQDPQPQEFVDKRRNQLPSLFDKLYFNTSQSAQPTAINAKGKAQSPPLDSTANTSEIEEPNPPLDQKVIGEADRTEESSPIQEEEKGDDQKS